MPSLVLSDVANCQLKKQTNVSEGTKVGEKEEHI